MTNRFYPAVLAVAFLCQACSDPAAPVTMPDVLMELETGNRWIGHLTGDVEHVDTLRITGDTLVGGELWHFVVRTPKSLGSWSRPDMAFTHNPYMINRADGLYVPVFRTGAKNESRRFIKYPVAVGDTISDSGWWSVITSGYQYREFAIVTGLHETINVPAGSFAAFKVRIARTFEPADSAAADPTRYDVAWFAPRAGLIRAEKYDTNGEVAALWELIDLRLN